MSVKRSLYQSWARMTFAGVLLASLAACAFVIHDEGVARLVPPIPQTGSTQLGFAEDRRFTVQIDEDTRISPVPLIEPGAVEVRRAPGSRIYLAGSPDGTQPIEVDDFLLIEIEDPGKPSGVRQFVAGDVGQVRRQGIPIDSLYDDSGIIPPTALDLTPYIPECTIRLVGAMPLDVGTIAQTSGVYLIVDYPPSDWAKQSCAGE